MSTPVSTALVIAALDRLLRTQPASSKRLATHAGRTVRFSLPLLALNFSFNNQGGLEPAAADVTPDTEIQLNAAILLRLALHDPQALPAAPVSGNLGLARDLLGCLRDFDLALVLAPLTGDSVAARADAAIGLLLRGRRNALATLAGNSAEYLIYEARLLASASAVAEFNLGVDQVREGLDRLEARLNYFEQHAPGEAA
jgi:ubiquinone biosynthesis protein UbiJ